MAKDVELVICMGPICSGKTSWSLNYLTENPEFNRVNVDEIRMMLKGELQEVTPSLRRMYSQFVTNSIFHFKKVLLDGYFLDIDHLLMFVHCSNKVTLKLMDITMQEAMFRNVNRKKETGIWVEPQHMIDYRNAYSEFLKTTEFTGLVRNTKVDTLIDTPMDVNKYFIKELAY